VDAFKGPCLRWLGEDVLRWPGPADCVNERLALRAMAQLDAVLRGIFYLATPAQASGLESPSG